MFLFNESTINHNKILDIIKDFKKHDKWNVMNKTFSHGFCYDFAIMLYRNIKNSRILYIVNKHHYVLESNGKYYDITGEISLDENDNVKEDDYRIKSW